MDKIDCLKSLTENIVTKQNDSVESIKKLSQAVDSVSSDISNLINSLQMVGNRQFAENRIHEDNSLTGGDQLVDSPINQEQSKRAPQENSHIRSSRDLDVSFDENELSLFSILHKATRLLPSIVDEDQDQYEDEDEAADGDVDAVEDADAAEHADLVGHAYADRAGQLDKDGHREGENDTESKVVHENLADNRSIKDDRDIDDNQSTKVKPIDRDRVADILKRYSLYDDDEDDEEDDYEGE